MDSRPYLSLTGLYDYSNTFVSPPIYQLVIGTIFFFVSFLVFIPEILELIEKRTNHGLSPWYTFGNNVGQWLLVMNFVCLNFDEFPALLQHSFSRAYPSFLVFVELLCQWVFFLPCCILSMVYQDRELRGVDNVTVLKKDKLLNNGLIVANFLIIIASISIWIYLGVNFGFGCQAIRVIGMICGIASSLLELVQYVPQYIETIKIRSSGSLSLVMLGIETPTALLNAIYMAVGTKEDWTTYISFLIDFTAEGGIIVMCLIFKLLNKNTEVNRDFERAKIALTPIEAATI